MDAQELRNLQEAYSQVYKLDEGLDRKTFEANREKAARSAASADARSRGHVDRLTGKPYSTDEARSRRRGIHTPEKAPERDAARDAAGGETGRGGRLRPNKVRKAKALGELGEQADIYDIILSHLLDEGYAETPEAAEAIMVNMSEEWRESIVDEMLDEANRGDEYATRNMSPDAARKYKETRRNTQFVNNKPKAMRNYYGGRSSGDLTAMRQEQRPKKKPLARSAGYDPETRTRDPNKIPMGKYENMLDKKRNPQRSGGYYG